MRNLLALFALIALPTTFISAGNVHASDSKSLVGSWKWISTKSPGAYMDPFIAPMKPKEAPIFLTTMDILTDGTVKLTEVDEGTGLLTTSPYGQFAIISAKDGSGVQMSIRLVPKRTEILRELYKETGLPYGFDGVAKISLSEDNSKLFVEFPAAVVTYEKISSAQSKQLVDERREMIAIARQRTAKLFSLVKGKTFGLVEVNTVEFDETGKVGEPTVIPATEVEESRVFGGDEGSFAKSDDQIEKGKGPITVVNIKTIKFEAMENNGSLAVRLNEKYSDRARFDLGSQSGLLYMQVESIDAQGKFDYTRFVEPYGGAIFLKGEKLEIRLSMREENNEKKGFDTTFRFQVKK